MLTVLTGIKNQLPIGVEMELATYRHSVFIDALEWQPPVENQVARDKFDRTNAAYIVARNRAGPACGCACLPPPTKPYLLDEIFPHLMNGQLAPYSPEVWELSQFSTKPIDRKSPISREEARERFRDPVVAIVQAAAAHGVMRLITFTTMGAERILRSIGIHAHRVGLPHLIDDEPALALWIELDNRTRQALQSPTSTYVGNHH